MTHKLMLLGGGGGPYAAAPPFQMVAAPDAGGLIEVSGPHAAYANGRTYVVWVGGNSKVNDIEIISRADAAGEDTYTGPVLLHDNLNTGGSTSPDSHNCPSVLPLIGGGLVVAYCGHAEGSMRSKVSNDPVDIIAGFTPPAMFSGPGAGVLKTYPQLAQLSAAGNRVYIRYRGTAAGEAGLYQQFSDDDGASWGAATELFHTTEDNLYSTHCSNGVDRIYQVVIDRAHDAPEGHGMWAFYTDETGDVFRLDGTQAPGSAPHTTADLTEIVPAGGDQYPYACSLTADGRLVIAWQTRNQDPIRFGEFRETAVGSGVFDEREIGTSELLFGTVESVGGGAHAANNANRFLTGKVISGTIHVYLYESADDGATWTGRSIDTATCAPSPIAVVNPGPEVTWVYFSEGFTDSSDFDPDLRAVA